MSSAPSSSPLTCHVTLDTFPDYQAQVHEDAGEGRKESDPPLHGGPLNILFQIKDKVQFAADKVQRAADKVQAAGLNIADKVQKGLNKTFHAPGTDHGDLASAVSDSSRGGSASVNRSRKEREEEIEWARFYDTVYPNLDSVLSSHPKPMTPPPSLLHEMQETEINLSTRLQINYLPSFSPSSSSSSAPQVQVEALEISSSHDEPAPSSIPAPRLPPPPGPPNSSSYTRASQQPSSTVHRSVDEIKLKYSRKSTLASSSDGQGASAGASRSAGGVSRELNEARGRLEERGEKIKSLENKAANLEDAAMGFEEMARKLKEKNKGWF